LRESPWGGCRRTLGALLVSLALSAPAVASEPSEDPEDGGAKVDVRIELPKGPAPKVSVTLGEGGVSLDLPRGVTYPMDIVSASGGLLRDVQVTPVSAERIRLDLKLAAGLIGGFAVDPSSVVVTLVRRGTSSVPDSDSDAQYRLGPEDKISLSVAGHPDLAQQLVVGGNGTVVAPMLGEITAAGLTPRELSARLTELFARDYFVDPQVEIQVLEYRSKWVMVTGEVRSPGRIPLHGGSTLKDVLVDAGGLTTDAGEEILVTRTGSVPGAPGEAIRVDREAFENGEANPTVGHGDIVNVRPVEWVFLEGEVRVPGKQRIERGLTLLKALALGGGFTEWANRNSITIRRSSTPPKDEVFRLKDIEARRVPDPPIRGGDIVIVKRRFL
jgi:polysaccharide biosynthesis/export protein